VRASWQLDLWGKLRRGSEAARANLLGSREARRGVILTLVSSVATGYITLRALDRQLQIARQTARNWQENYRLFTAQYEQGLISELELNQAKAQYAQARAAIPPLLVAIGQQEGALNVLLGQTPDSIPRGRSIDELLLPAVPAGLPCTLLINRPDIREAEQALIAANAQIGVARSQYFPDISLTGLFGLVSTELSELFTNPVALWTAGLPITAPLFDFGAIRGQVKSARAAARQALLGYRSTILTALREVEDALLDQQQTRLQLQAVQAQTQAQRNALYYVRLQYEHGYVRYTDVLTSELSLFQTELALVQTRGRLFVALVNLNAAMGCGWQVSAPPSGVR
jgi:multidrug efflux system outer membrane protein